MSIQHQDKLEKAGGIFGIYAPEKELEVAKLTYFGLYALQHRGQKSAGIATLNQSKIYCHKDIGLVSQIFNEKILKKLLGKIAVGHISYSANASISKENVQPVILDTKLGKLALAHNGSLVNAGELRQHLNKANLDDTTDSEIIALTIADEINNCKDWRQGAINAFKLCSGAYSLIIITPVGMIGARDRNGIRPLVIGILPEAEEESSSYILSSETCALDIIGAEYVRDVNPGEVVWITKSGLVSINWAEQVEKKLCIYEMIYFARPDSRIYYEDIYNYRIRLGKILAKESYIDADLVIGIPDSGIPAAIGFSHESGLSYEEGIIRNRYVGRALTQPSRNSLKFNSLKDTLHGKRIIVVDDSIVQGTNSKQIVKMLRDAGVTEIHMRISSLPMTHPCFYGINTHNQNLLIAATKSVKEIERYINVDTLAYLTWEGMLEATKKNINHFCSACFTGDYPVEKNYSSWRW